MAPLSRRLSPTRQRSASRMPKSSTLSPSSEGTSASARTTTASRLELHLGSGGRVGRGLEVRLRLETGEAGHEAIGKDRQPSVVLAHRLVVAAALDHDAVLGALELRLQREEVLVALQLRITLDRDQQPAQRSAQLLLRGLEALH